MRMTICGADTIAVSTSGDRAKSYARI